MIFPLYRFAGYIKQEKTKKEQIYINERRWRYLHGQFFYLECMTRLGVTVL